MSTSSASSAASSASASASAATAKKLYLVHCGYYDSTVLDAVYEFHVNLVVAAASFEDARAQAKLDPTFSAKRMHVDGVQEIEAVNGYRVSLAEDASLAGATRITSSRHRDLAPKNPASASP